MLAQPVQFGNPLNLSRVTIGVTNRDGERAAIVLTKAVTDDYAPLVPVLDSETSEIRNPNSEIFPTEQEINELYLTCSGWTRMHIDGIGDVWEDPISGGAFAFADAIQTQDRREESDARAHQPIDPLQVQTVGI